MAENEQSERDTHFARAAHLLFNELYERGLIARPDIRVYRDNFNGAATWQNEVRQNGEQIIARFAYDLVEHAVEALKPSIYTNTFSPETEISETIPDLTEWPPPSER